jgi:hypothetical protein
VLEDLGADVAALFGPLARLLGQDGADQADDCVAAGEDPDDVGASADLRGYRRFGKQRRIPSSEVM